MCMYSLQETGKSAGGYVARVAKCRRFKIQKGRYGQALLASFQQSSRFPTKKSASNPLADLRSTSKTKKTSHQRCSMRSKPKSAESLESEESKRGMLIFQNFRNELDPDQF